MRLAHEEGLERIGRELAGFMPGDSHRSLRHDTSLRDEVIDLVLLSILP